VTGTARRASATARSSRSNSAGLDRGGALVDAQQQPELTATLAEAGCAPAPRPAARAARSHHVGCAAARRCRSGEDEGGSAQHRGPGVISAASASIATTYSPIPSDADSPVERIAATWTQRGQRASSISIT
jgi:hypothetical protein